MTNAELMKAVKQYALDHYEERGWDVLVECHTEAEIAAAIGNATTVPSACANVSKALGLRVFDEHRKDIQAEIF